MIEYVFVDMMVNHRQTLWLESRLRAWGFNVTRAAYGNTMSEDRIYITAPRNEFGRFEHAELFGKFDTSYNWITDSDPIFNAA